MRKIISFLYFCRKTSMLVHLLAFFFRFFLGCFLLLLISFVCKFILILFFTFYFVSEPLFSLEIQNVQAQSRLSFFKTCQTYMSVASMKHSGNIKQILVEIWFQFPYLSNVLGNQEESHGQNKNEMAVLHLQWFAREIVE